MEITTKSTSETKALGKRLSNSLKGGEVFALCGSLGSGKTVFVQGVAEGLGIEKVVSPTFMLLRGYAVKDKLVKTLYHMDLYRLEGDVVEEVKGLGVEEIWFKKENVVFVEWADKARDVFPDQTHWIAFESIDQKTRRVTTDFDLA